MNRVQARALAGVSSLALVGWALVGLPAAAAAGSPIRAADSRSGKCTTDDQNAVTLVIDYQGLGGATAISCVTGLGNGATGWDVLKAAGVATAGTVHDGESFVCRLNGRPSRTEVIPLKGDPGYTEQCVNTPPATAYWSYWWAAPGGSWTYSQLGVMSSKVKLGGFEGWSFSLNASASTNPKPGVSPVLAPGSGGSTSGGPSSGGSGSGGSSGGPAGSGGSAAGASAPRVGVKSATVKVTKKPTTKKTGKATVAVASKTGAKVTGGAVLVLKKGTTTKKVAVPIVNGRGSAVLPKLKKGRWKLQAQFRANDRFKARKGTTITFKVTK